MAQVRVCDRCGRLIQGAVESGWIEVSPDLKKVEFCALCWRALNKWLENDDPLPEFDWGIGERLAAASRTRVEAMEHARRVGEAVRRAERESAQIEGQSSLLDDDFPDGPPLQDTIEAAIARSEERT